jgi:hypothetical protein
MTHELTWLIVLLQYNERYDTVISCDEGGFIEYWQPQEPWELPTGIKGMWEFKSSTDLYEFKKVRSASSLCQRSSCRNASI